MYYTRHERNMQDAFCNFLHIVSYRCGISTLQPAILFIWIAVSAVDSADPICFIYGIRSSPCRKVTGASFPQGRAYGGQDTDLLQIHLSGRTRETLIKSLSDLALVFSYKARNKPPRIASYLRRVMTKHCMKIHAKSGSAI